MNDLERLQLLESRIKEWVPSFEVRFKDESKFMKLLGKVMFFNKGFMTNFITTIGTKVYFPNRADYLARPLDSFRTLAHEFVHVYDYVLNPVGFMLGYLFPQNLALLSLFAILAFISPCFLLFLLSLLFLAPIPSIPRKNIEMRGYGMSLKVEQWSNCPVSYVDWCMEKYADNFVNSNYYYMYPFRESVKKELKGWLTDSCLQDKNVAYSEVYSILTQ